MNLLQAESGLSLVQEREDPPIKINSITSPPYSFDVPDADLIIRSSDLVNFRVHKPVLAMASPFFKDLLSLPQPSDGESIDGLPMVQLSEDSDVLGTLVSMLYPLRPVIPKSYEKVSYSLATFSAVEPKPCYQVLYLLAVCQKYEMDAVQASIRAEVNQEAFPTPKGAEVFSAYGIASRKGLIPEMEKAARQTLDHPMTFEILGEGLRSFEGWALLDLANFRKRYRDNLVSCFKSFLKIEEMQLDIWTYCDYNVSRSGSYSLPIFNVNGFLPSWVVDLYQKHIDGLQEAFSKSLFNPQNIRGEYLSALQDHIKSHVCVSCAVVHIEKGETLFKDLENRLTQAVNEVCPCSVFWSCGSLSVPLT